MAIRRLSHIDIVEACALGGQFAAVVTLAKEYQEAVRYGARTFGLLCVHREGADRLADGPRDPARVAKVRAVCESLREARARALSLGGHGAAWVLAVDASRDALVGFRDAYDLEAVASWPDEGGEAWIFPAEGAPWLVGPFHPVALVRGWEQVVARPVAFESGPRSWMMAAGAHAITRPWRRKELEACAEALRQEIADWNASDFALGPEAGGAP